ncbi:MAG: hypothetical protein JSW58_08390 [Candidatus Latescibacterota bacterium]|nr:MAG: hypothetical protein JSW58_08390 [Candidatus Latescibacterota bacterium]
MRERSAKLHHGGSDRDNPILAEQRLTIVLNKQDADQALKKVWVSVAGAVFFDLTSLAVETDTTVTVDVIAGTHLQSGFPAIENTIHFTTTPHVHSKQAVWVASQPEAMITLDGYNANDPSQPLIYPIYV